MATHAVIIMVTLMIMTIKYLALVQQCRVALGYGRKKYPGRNPSG